MSNKVLKIIGLIVVCFIILSAIVCISGVLFSTSFKGSGESGKDSNQYQSKLKEEKKDFTKTENSFKNDEFEFKILKVNKNYTQEYMHKENKNYKVVKIDIEIKNLSKKDIYVNEFIAKSNDKMLVKNYSINDAIYGMNNKILPSSTISGSVGFEIPKENKEMTLIYDYGFLQDKKLSFNIDVK